MRIMKPDVEVTGCPDNIPASLLNEEQAYENHSQTLKRLSERGGLSACEAVAIIEHRRWKKMNPQDAVNALNNYIANQPINEQVSDDR